MRCNSQLKRDINRSILYRVCHEVCCYFSTIAFSNYDLKLAFFNEQFRQFCHDIIFDEDLLCRSKSYDLFSLVFS